ncbi:MAG: cytochrome c3 family protein [Planctomycetes bacterium]|nr:cytochrome c3 family protein [Planctomycetota bacterium]
MAAVGAVVGTVYVIVLVTFGASPYATNVGYQPIQPVPYSHEIHAGKLGIDCRYCHTGVETAAGASIPPTQTCIGCHTTVKPNAGTDEYKLGPLEKSYETGLPVEWVRVHDLPDFVYFNHSAHVRRGIGCVSCHGRIDKMTVVHQAKPLSMGWCLKCHRDPAPHVRPLDKITKMDWVPEEEDPETLSALRKNVNASTDCSTCHR